MPLQRIKMIVSTSWVFLAMGIAIVAPLPWHLQLAITALGLLPPLALLLWWNEPAQSMTEAINEVRRGH